MFHRGVFYTYYEDHYFVSESGRNYTYPLGATRMTVVVQLKLAPAVVSQR